MTLSAERMRKLLRMPETRLTLVASETDDCGGHLVEHLRFRLPDGTAVRGFLTRPKDMAAPGPAILYAHAHGGRYDIGAAELVEGRPALIDAPGPMLAREGYVTVCIDMPTFGARADVSENSSAKASLWKGETLFGRMLGENAAALSWLAARPEVDPGRIGMTGISMGATLAYFLAAVDPRVKAVAHLCCYADFATLVETGAHDLHGHYLTIPGLLAETSTGEIAGMVAPRPQLICVGLDDPLTPPEAIHRALAESVAAYERAGAGEALTIFSQAGVGHCETAEMRAAVLAFFRRCL